MEIGSAAIGPEGGHLAGRKLLQTMYENRYHRPMPEILTTEQGKPYFVGDPVYFSVSHTKTRVFCALSERPVGIDAEDMTRYIRLELAEKILSPSEKLRYAAAEDKNSALLRFWVLEEAAAKCTGEGLRGYPDHTDFSPDDPRVQMLEGCFVAVVEK